MAAAETAGRAGLPMYDFPEIAEATDAWWSGLAAAFHRAGVPGVPDRRYRPNDPAALWANSSLLFAQTCGFPLTHAFAGKLTPIGTPCYRAEGCSGSFYRSVVVVGRDRAGTALEEFRGAVTAVNQPDSQSGWNALAALAAPLARDGRFFGDVRLTGGHAASLAAVAEGAADLAAIDAVTFALLGRYRSQAVAGVRTLTVTEPAPGLPYVTRADMPEDVQVRLSMGLAEAAADPALADVREALLIEGVEFLDMAAYAAIPAMAKRALRWPG